MGKLIILLILSTYYLTKSQSCNGLYVDLDETYNDCTISPQGSQVLTFDGTGYSISMGLWIQISASVTSTAYIMRLTLDPTNDAASEYSKVMSLELNPTTGISFKYSAKDSTNPPSHRYDYEAASLSSYSLNKWYWIYLSLKENPTLKAQDQLTGIYDPSVPNYILSDTQDWDNKYLYADFSTAGYMVYMNGFQGYGLGFCGKVRGMTVARGVQLSFANAYENMAQKQVGGKLSDLLLYLPLDSHGGNSVADYSNNGLYGQFGSLLYPDHNDPLWEQESKVMVFGIVIKPTAELSLYINDVELSLNIILPLGEVMNITVMCTTYGNRVKPACKAYQGTTRTLSLTDITTSLSDAATDTLYLGDRTCGFDGYLSQIVIAKDGNIMDSTLSCSSCELAISLNGTNQFCLQCPSGQVSQYGACSASCGTGFLKNSNTSSCYCPSGNYIDNGICTACSSECSGCSSVGSNHCLGCVITSPALYLTMWGTCVTTCPFGTFADASLSYCDFCDTSCDGCTGPGNSNCESCVSGFYQQPAPLATTCLATCPQAYFPDDSTNTCEPCVQYCEMCTGPTNVECSQWNCPAGMYFDADNIGCEDCIAPCKTCSDATTCTSCVSHYFEKLDPSTGELACLLKTSLSMTLKAASADNPRQVFVSFSASVANKYLNFFLTVLKVTLQGKILDPSLFTASIYDQSTLNLTLTKQNIPNQASLRVELTLDSNFNTNPRNEYELPSMVAELALAGSSPLTQAEQNLISSVSQVSSSSADLTSAAQVFTSVLSSSVGGIASATAASFLMMFRLITDLIQILQFLDIDWSENVMELYRQAYIDPANLVLPICLVPIPPEEQLSDVTLSKVLQLQNISPVFFYNNCQAFTTMMLLLCLVFGLKIILLFKKPRFVPLKLSQFAIKLDRFLAWNIVMMIFISNFPLYLGFSLLQLYYASFATVFEDANFCVALISVIVCGAFVTWILILAWRYSKINPENSAEIQKFHRVDSLFQGLRTEKKLQLFQIPISMARTFVMVVIVITLSERPWIATNILWILQAVFIGYLIIYRPYESKFEFGSSLIAEFMLLTAFLCAFGMKIVTSSAGLEHQADDFGWAIISINFAVSMLTMGIVVKIVFEALFWVFQKTRPFLCKKRRRDKVLPALSPVVGPTDISSPTTGILISRQSSDLKNGEKRPSLLIVPKFKKTELESLDDGSDFAQNPSTQSISRVSLKATRILQIKASQGTNPIQSPSHIELFNKPITNISSNREVSQSSLGTSKLNWETLITDPEHQPPSPISKINSNRNSHPEEKELINSKRDTIEEGTSRSSVAELEYRHYFFRPLEMHSLTPNNNASLYKPSRLGFLQKVPVFTPNNLQKHRNGVFSNLTPQAEIKDVSFSSKIIENRKVSASKKNGMVQSLKEDDMSPSMKKNGFGLFERVKNSAAKTENHLAPSLKDEIVGSFNE